MPAAIRNVVFISKATPGDDEFVPWLAPRLEAAGYTVFADILSLEAGTRWRKEITATLQDRTVKMLLCCRDSTLASDGVQEEIDIADDLVKQLPDPRFIVPLRFEPYKKVFGIGELQRIDFTRGWANGLDKLLAALRRQRIPRDVANISINQNWELFRRRAAVQIRNEPERLTSNWLPVVELPDAMRILRADPEPLIALACPRPARYPASRRNREFFPSAAWPRSTKGSPRSHGSRSRRNTIS